MSENNPLHIWESPFGTFCTGLFKMHDTYGFPLSFSLGECYKRGWIPCLSDFVADAIQAGWSRDRVRIVVQEAVSDAPEIGTAVLRRVESLYPWMRKGQTDEQ